MGVSGDAIATIIHLTHQNLHVDITRFGFLEGVLEPPLDAVSNHHRQRHTWVLVAAAAVAVVYLAATALHPRVVSRLLTRTSLRVHEVFCLFLNKLAVLFCRQTTCEAVLVGVVGFVSIGRFRFWQVIFPSTVKIYSTHN